MYSETKPIAPLSHFVECIWTSERSQSEINTHEQRILPDGCADLIFNLTPGQESASWVGTMTTSLVIRGSESTKMIGIRFNPGGARSLLGIPLSEITDERVNVSEVTPSLSRATDSLLSNPSIKALQDWLLNVVEQDRSFGVIQQISQIINNAEGDIRVSDISDHIGISRQYLNRITRDYVGIDLKSLQRILRMRRLTEGLRVSNDLNIIDWACLAPEYGFYDQSHLIHEFKDIVGVLPSQFIK